MRPRHREPRGFSLLAGVLIATFLAQAFLAGVNKSPVFDETGDIAAGLSYVQTDEIRANLQHPPLLKQMAGAALWLAGVRLPESLPVRQMLADGGGERAVGAQLIAANPDRTMLLARIPFLLLAATLGALLYLWGRQLLGEVAAVAALFLYTLDPNILGHGYLSTTDVGLAAFTLLFLFVLWHYLERPANLRLICCGVAMGLMLCTKFSAVFMLPVAAVLMLLAVDRRSKARQSYSALMLALIVMCAIASLVIQAIYLSPGGLYLYSTGLTRVNADHNPDYLVFLGGRLAHHFTSYFAAAYLLKEPVAAIVLAIVGLCALRGNASRRVKLFLLLPPAALFAAHTAFADNLGMRYIIPVLPFAYLIGGAGAAWLIRRGALGRAVAAALGLWSVIAAVGIYPDHLSYFNEGACLSTNPRLIGFDSGTRCGPLWLDDSNVDWGQSLKQVKDWADRNAKGQPIHLAYFGSFPPAAYGLNAEAVSPELLARDPKAGIYVVSAHFVARTPAAWLRTPTEIIGHSMYVYRVSGKQPN